MIPAGATPINQHVGVFNEGEHWTYVLGLYPVYRHRAGDLEAFRLTIAQLAAAGACRLTPNGYFLLARWGTGC